MSDTLAIQLADLADAAYDTSDLAVVIDDRTPERIQADVAAVFADFAAEEAAD